MSVRLAVLAVLQQGPCYGAQLRSELLRRSPDAPALNIGQVHNTLERLERDHLARRSATGPTPHAYWETTQAGTQLVQSWLGMTYAHPPQRHELVSKILLAISLPGVDHAAIVSDQLRATEQLLDALRSQPAPASLLENLARAAEIARIEAEATWLRTAEQLATQPNAPGMNMPLETELPRRGRPAKAS